MEADDTVAIKSLVEAGFGYSICRSKRYAVCVGGRSRLRMDFFAVDQDAAHFETFDVLDDVGL
jgi:hypothetical protein